MLNKYDALRGAKVQVKSVRCKPQLPFHFASSLLLYMEDINLYLYFNDN